MTWEPCKWEDLKIGDVFRLANLSLTADRRTVLDIGKEILIYWDAIPITYLLAVGSLPKYVFDDHSYLREVP